MTLKFSQISFFVAATAIATISMFQSAQSAQCVNVSLLDANGVIVPTDEPVVGMMVGGVPAIEGNFPPHVGRSAGSEAPCPQPLVDQVTELFTQTCTTSERRDTAAQQFGVDASVIAKGCLDMNEALNEGED